MTAAYSVGPISRIQVDRVYCLIEAAGYDMDLNAWRQFCATAFAREYPLPYSEQIVTVENARGYITGVSIMRTRHGEPYGRYLDVPVFLVVSAGDTRGSCDTLLGYLKAVARDRHCRFIRVASLEPNKWPRASGVLHEDDSGILVPVPEVD